MQMYLERLVLGDMFGLGSLYAPESVSDVKALEVPLGAVPLAGLSFMSLHLGDTRHCATESSAVTDRRESRTGVNVDIHE